MVFEFIATLVLVYYSFQVFIVDIKNRTDYDQTGFDMIITYFKNNLVVSLICTIIFVVSMSIGTYYLFSDKKKNEQLIGKSSADPIID